MDDQREQIIIVARETPFGCGCVTKVILDSRFYPTRSGRQKLGLGIKGHRRHTEWTHVHRARCRCGIRIEVSVAWRLSATGMSL